METTFRLPCFQFANSQSFLSVDFLKYYSTDELSDISLGLETFEQGVNAYKVTYESTDLNGEEVILSGLIALPEDLTKEYPLLCYQHGTAGNKEGVPSRLQGDGVIGIAMAGKGYVTVATDYIGLGDHFAVHPYMHAASESWTAVDIMRAMRVYALDNGIYMNDQVFVTGYSQGGHAAMALHSHLEQNLSDEFDVVAAAPMSGPYSVAEVMKDLILSGDEYGKPAYLINTFTSYQEIYGNVYPSIDATFKPPYRSAVAQFTNNEISLDELNQSLIDSLEKNEGASIPLKVMEESYVEAVTNNLNHPMRMAMEENNVYDWSPQAPTRLYYCEADEEVPYMNSIVAEEALQNNGAVDVLAISSNATSNHFFCALPSSVATIEFFEMFQMIEDAPLANSETFEDEFQIFPNPAKHQIVIPNDKEGVEVFISDLNGKLLLQNTLTLGENVIQVSSLKSGIYLVQLMSDNKLKSQKLVVE